MKDVLKRTADKQAELIVNRMRQKGEEPHIKAKISTAMSQLGRRGEKPAPPTKEGKDKVTVIDREKEQAEKERQERIRLEKKATRLENEAARIEKESKQREKELEKEKERVKEQLARLQEEKKRGCSDERHDRQDKRRRDPK